MYVKLFSSILDSSVWGEDHATVRLWITMLCMADPAGTVRASFGGLARRAGITREECRAGLAILEGPDLESKDPDFGGRRVDRMDGGWKVLNYQKYREIQTPQQRADAERARRYRERHRDPSRDGHDASQHTEAEAEAEKSTVATQPAAPTPCPPTNWKAEAAVTLRESGVPESEIGDAIKNFWGPARRPFTDGEIAAVVRAHGARFRAKGQTWNPARVWNPRSDEFSERFRWAIGQQRRKDESRSSGRLTTLKQELELGR